MAATRHLRRAAIAAGVAAALAVPPVASAVPAGTGVRGTVTVAWGNVAGAPITAWDGTATLAFDPSSAARREARAALADPSLGEQYRPIFAPQLQAARVTALSGTKVQTVTCTTNDADGNLVNYDATYTESVAGVADGRVAFEILPPRVDLISGRGTITLALHAQMHPDGWYVRDRVVLPGRWTSSGAWPCPGEGQPVDALPRILSPNGGGAIPVAISDWMRRGELNLRSTGGSWRVLMNLSRRDTFSESRFGPQDAQQLDLRVASNLYLAGSLTELGARCRVPYGLIERAASGAVAVRNARRAGLTGTRFAGVRRVLPPGFRPRNRITGRLIDSMGHAPCYRGTYRIHRDVPRS